jgi:putative FmdB family regulatory protein
MPIYEYEHTEKPCSLGKVFEVEQSVRERELKQCPNCHAPVRKIVSRFYVSAPKGDTELRDKGFTKLVRRDDGVYENVTARDGESRYVRQDKPETLPNLKKIIRD